MRSQPAAMTMRRTLSSSTTSVTPTEARAGKRIRRRRHLGRASWEPILRDRRSAEIIMAVFALVRDDPDIFEDRITPEMRDEILDQLPVSVQTIAAYWPTRLAGEQ